MRKQAFEDLISSLQTKQIQVHTGDLILKSLSRLNETNKHLQKLQFQLVSSLSRNLRLKNEIVKLKEIDFVLKYTSNGLSDRNSAVQEVAEEAYSSLPGLVSLKNWINSFRESLKTSSEESQQKLLDLLPQTIERQNISDDFTVELLRLCFSKKEETRNSAVKCVSLLDLEIETSKKHFSVDEFQSLQKLLLTELSQYDRYLIKLYSTQPGDDETNENWSSLLKLYDGTGDLKILAITLSIHLKTRDLQLQNKLIDFCDVFLNKNTIEELSRETSTTQTSLEDLLETLTNIGNENLTEKFLKNSEVTRNFRFIVRLSFKINLNLLAQLEFQKLDSSIIEILAEAHSLWLQYLELPEDDYLSVTDKLARQIYSKKWTMQNRNYPYCRNSLRGKKF